MTHANANTRRNSRDVLANIRRRTLHDGSRIGEVPLRGADAVTLDEADLDRIHSLGISMAWFRNGGGYVRAQAPARLGIPNLVTVARIIMGPLPDMVVKYRDGDRLNLRRKNLYLDEATRTSAKARERFFEPLAIAAE